MGLRVTTGMGMAMEMALGIGHGENDGTEDGHGTGVCRHIVVLESPCCR